MLGGFGSSTRRQLAGFVVLAALMVGALVWLLALASAHPGSRPVLVHQPDSSVRDVRPGTPETVCINQAGVTELSRAGFSARNIVTICKYRERGGTFRSIRDLYRLRSLDTAVLAALAPHLSFGTAGRPAAPRPDNRRRATERVRHQPRLPLFRVTPDELALHGIDQWVADSLARYRELYLITGSTTPDSLQALTPADFASFMAGHLGEPRRRTTATAATASQPVMVDLNTATVDELKTVRGIGTATATQIVELRNRLGGAFLSKDQLLSISFFCRLDTQRIFAQTYLGPKRPELIHINRISIDRLAANPYMTRVLAEQIVRRRARRGNYTCPADLRKIPAVKHVDPIFFQYLSYD